MAATLVASDVFTFADANGGHALTASGSPSAGDVDVLLVGSVTVISSLTGSYTLDESHLDQDAVSAYHRVCGGSEGTALGTVTTAGNFNTAVLWQRWRGLDAYEVSVLAFSGGSGSSPVAATGALTVDGELGIGMAFMSQTGAGDQAVTSWADGFTADKSAVLGSSSLGVFAASAWKTAGITAAGGASPAVSWSGDATNIATTVVWAFTVAAGGLTGEIAGTFGAATGALVGVTAAPATLAGTFGAATGALSGVLTPTAVLSGTLPAATGALAGESTPVAVLVGTFAPMTGALVGAPQPLGVLGGNLPRLAGALISEAAAPDIPQGDWWTLKAVADNNRAWREEERNTDPVACPNDGEPLVAGPDGVLFCRFDGWRPRRS